MSIRHAADSSIYYDSDEEDLDLTEETHVSEDEVEEYMKFTDSSRRHAGSIESLYVSSLHFKPLTASCEDSTASSDIARENSPIYVHSTDEDDVPDLPTPKGCSTAESSPVHSDPPDYESPTEDLLEFDTTKPSRSPEECVDFAYDELLEFCGQGSSKGHKTYDDDSDDDGDFFLTKKERQFVTIRKRRYQAEEQVWMGEGKGKQLVSGSLKKKKMSRSYSPNLGDKEMIVTDSAKQVGTVKTAGLSDSADLDAVASFLFEDSEPYVPPAPPMVCEACRKEESHNSVVQCCEGHIVCTKCVEISTKTEFSEAKKGFVNCPHPECESSVPQSELRKALPSLVLDLLEDSWKKQTTEAIEKMNDIVICPSCEFPAALDMDVKRFDCVQCKEAYCRYCEMKWVERPSHDLCIKTKKWTSTVTGSIVNIPAHWSESDYNTEGHVVKEVSKSTPEFRDVEAYMSKFMPVNVSKVFRIQNERLWEKYSLTRCHMVADLGELDINERRLFHGTTRDVIEAICKEGFDWRLCGKHGVAYGQGSYFAKSPLLSHRYSCDKSSRRSSGFAAFTFGLAGFGMGHLLARAHGTSTPNYKPPLRFGAPMTTSGNSATTSASSAPVFGNSAARTMGSSGYLLAKSTPSMFLPNTGFFAVASSAQQNSYGNFMFGASATTAQLNSSNSSEAATVSLSKSTTVQSDRPPHALRGIPLGGCHLPSPSLVQSQSQSPVTNTSQRASSQSQTGITLTQQGPSNLAVHNPQTTTSPSSGDQLSSVHRHGNFVLTHEQQFSGNIRRKYVRAKRHGNKAPVQSSAVSSTDLQNFSGIGPSGNSSIPVSSNNNSSSSSSSSSSCSISGNTTISSVLFNEADSTTTNNNFMFLARVLVGRSCIGSSHMRRPERDSQGRETHSAVDNEHGPSVFVIFDNTQCYPEYLIQYSVP